MLTKNTDQLRRVVSEHIAQDSIVQGTYWNEETASGCFIGCLAHDNRPELNERQYGLPVMLQRIAESIFEKLPADEAKEFFNSLPDAVRCDGKDLTKVGWQFMAAELRALPQQSPDIQAVIDPVIVGIELLAAGQEWGEAAAKAAADAALAVANAAAWADAADVAGDAAAAAGDAAAAAADAARAATWAAWATAAAARAADVAALAARRRQRDLLLRLIAEAPVVEQLQELEEQGND